MNRPPSQELLRPITQGWIGKIEEARRFRKGWDETAHECWQFFCGATGFMWEDKFRQKYIKGNISPRFRMTMAKAFELVAIVGPVLYWRNPQRVVKPKSRIDIPPEMFGSLQDPMAAAQYEQLVATRVQEDALNNIRAQLVEKYLNYTPNEQPYGGLATASERAITEALVKGRGCLWSETFNMPGSSRTLTGSFYDSVDNLFIDPDATCLEDAKWIARECVKPYWEAEREFDLPKGSLKEHADLESSESYGSRSWQDSYQMDRAQGYTYDQIRYYKVWSKGGVGARLSGVHTQIADHFDDVTGDYAYIVVAPSVPYPLNAPTDKFLSATDDEVERMFRWPIPYWLDERWPVSCLDFYQKPGYVWPIAPLAPAMGELIFINVMISHLSNRIWSSSRDFICILERARNEIESKIRNGDDLCIIGLSEVNKDISQVVQFLQQPNISTDAWQIIDRMMEIFDKRTGLSELLYGLNPGGTQERTATGMEAKRQMVSVRPDYMAGKVEQWQEDIARKEKIAAHFYVPGTSLGPLMDTPEQAMWDAYIHNEDPEIVVREMQVGVAAGSARKPNKERDAQNINTIAPSLIPELSKHADITTDTSQLNALYEQWGHAIDLDTSGLEMGPRTPAPPPPEVAQQMQAEADMEQQKQAAEIQKKQIEAEIKAIDLQIKQIEMAAQGESAEVDAARAQAELESDAMQKMQDLLFGQQKSEQELEQDQDTHLQDLLQQRQLGLLKLEQMRREGELKVQQARAAARAKPNGKPTNTSA